MGVKLVCFACDVVCVISRDCEEQFRDRVGVENGVALWHCVHSIGWYVYWTRGWVCVNVELCLYCQGGQVFCGVASQEGQAKKGVLEGYWVAEFMDCQ